MRKPITSLSVPFSAQQLAALQSAGFLILEDYGAFAIVEGTPSEVTRLQATTGLAFDADADAFLIHLGGIAIDTSAGALPPTLDKDLQLTDYDEPTGLYVLQFHGPLRPAWLDLLAAADVRPIQYVGSHAYTVAAPHGLSALQARFSAPVQHIGVLQPAFKLAPSIRAMDVSSNAPVPMTAILDGGQDLSAILATLASIDPSTRAPDGARGGQERVRFSATASQARSLSRSAGVLWIEPAPEPVLSDERADQLMLGNISGGQPTGAGQYAATLSNTLGLGTGVLSSEIVDVLDMGVELSGAPFSATCITPNPYVGHPDLNNSSNLTRLAYACPSTYDSNSIADGAGHGTIVTSMLAGNPGQTGGALSLFIPPDFTDSASDSGGFLWNTGVAPGVRFGSTRLFDDNGNRFNNQKSFSILANTAYSNGARYQNSSWNIPLDSYSADSQEYDWIVRDGGTRGATQPMTVVFSSGNYPSGGPLNTHAPATAKNVITVGASGVQRSVADVGNCNSGVGINDVTSFSARGGAYNANLFKPDLVAPGQVMVGALAMNAINHTYLNDCYGAVTALPSTGQHSAAGRGLYYPVQGTSYSAPQVTGAAVLVKKILGSVAPSLIKATLVANAESMHGGIDQLHYPATLGWEPSPIQGWGRLSLKRFFDGTSRVYASEYAPWAFTATGQSMYFTLTVSDPTKPVLVSLAWTDPAGQPGSSNPLVNSLALYVYHGNDLYCDGLNYYGGQYHTPQSMCWLAPDSVNNVKMIRIAPNTFPSNGQFTIQIYAVGINGIPAYQDWSAYAYNAR